MTSQADAINAVKAALQNTTPRQRADLLDALVQAVYDHVKFEAQGGGGLDGRDGPEREALAKVLKESRSHQIVMQGRDLPPDPPRG